MSTKDSRGRNKLWPWRSIWKMRTTKCNSNCGRKSLFNIASASRWLAAALQERKVAMRLGDCIPTPQQLTMGLPQGSLLSPVLYNVYTKGLADLNSNGLSRALALAQDVLIYKTASDVHTAVTAVQEQLEKGVTLVPGDSPKSIQARRKPCDAPSTTQHWTSNAGSLFQWRNHRTHEQSQIPRDPLR